MPKIQFFLICALLAVTQSMPDGHTNSFVDPEMKANAGDEVQEIAAEATPAVQCGSWKVLRTVRMDPKLIVQLGRRFCPRRALAKAPAKGPIKVPAKGPDNEWFKENQRMMDDEATAERPLFKRCSPWKVLRTLRLKKGGTVQIGRRFCTPGVKVPTKGPVKGHVKEFTNTFDEAGSERIRKRSCITRNGRRVCKWVWVN